MAQVRHGCSDFLLNVRPSRRDLLKIGSLGVFGLGLSEWLALQNCHANTGGKAKACILMFMWGGPSQLDTWDMKPDAPAEIRGEFKPISTNVPDIRISEHFPRLAKLADKYAIIRSMTHDDPAHLSSVHHILTGRHAAKVKSDQDPPSRKDWPHIGSVLAKMRPATSALPNFITMPWIVSHPAAPGGMAPGQNAGMLGTGYDPFVFAGDPNSRKFTVPGLSLPGDMTLPELDSRRLLLHQLDYQTSSQAMVAEAGGFSALQEKAFNLVSSPAARKAFDLNQEPPKVRARYGRHIHGQCLLLARRLVEAGVSLVCVNWHQDHKNFWDTHGDNFRRLKRDLMPPSDQGFSALLEDLSTRGMLDETLLVWVGEFGRKPQITKQGAGREHWPFCYSAVVAGGGVRGGQVYGKSDRQAGRPVDNPTSPADLAATIYHAFGVDTDLVLHDRENRAIRLTEGTPIRPIFV